MTADSRNAWDDEYHSRGPLWGGTPEHLQDIPAGSRVLEVGCGNGKTTGALVNCSCDITAVDFSEKAVKITRKSMARYSAIDSVVSDACYLPFHDNAFGYVVARHVIGHLSNIGRGAIAREASRVMQPGGHLIVQVFSVEDMRNGYGRQVEDGTFLRGRGIVTHYFTIPEIEALFPDLKRKSVAPHYWTIRVRGRDLLRAEIVALFQKEI